MLQQTGRSIAATLAIAALVLSTSCDKDDDGPNGGGAPAGKKITRFAVDANNYTSFTYNTEGRLNKMKTSIQIIGAPTIYETTFFYNGSKVKEMTNAEGEKSVVTYTGNYPSKSEDFNENNEKIAYDEFTWTNGKLAQVISYMPAAGNTFVTDSKVTYEYYANGNLKTVKTYEYVSGDAGFVMDERIEYQQYDSKFDPISMISNITVVVDPSYRPNNPTLVKKFAGDGSLVETIEKTYEYGADGYPTKLKEKHTMDGDEFELNFTYTY